MDRILERRLAKLTYSQPEPLLQSLIPVVESRFKIDETGQLLTGQAPKQYRERHQAAFLCFLMKHMAGPHATVTVCVSEADDFDCVIRMVLPGGETKFSPVQLKELPPHELNDEADLQKMIDHFKWKYASSPDLIISIWINRDIRFDFRCLDFEGLKIEQLWFFGDSASGAGEITLHGGLVSELLAGLLWAGSMKYGKAMVKPIRFTRTAADAG